MDCNTIKGVLQPHAPHNLCMDLLYHITFDRNLDLAEVGIEPRVPVNKLPLYHVSYMIKWTIWKNVEEALVVPKHWLGTTVLDGYYRIIHFEKIVTMTFLNLQKLIIGGKKLANSEL